MGEEAEQQRQHDVAGGDSFDPERDVGFDVSGEQSRMLRGELHRDLTAGVAGADHEHCAVLELRWAAG